MTTGDSSIPTEKLTFNSSLGEIKYVKTGSGNPVMLIHGFGEDSRIWENQVPVLSEKYLLLIPDIPGSGNSPIMNNGSIENYARVLKELCEEENLHEPVLIGHSMGGYISLAFADLFPDKIKAFCLFHSSAYADDEEKIATRRKGIEFIRKNGAAKFLAQATPNLFSEATRKNNPELLQETINRYANFSEESLVQYYEAMIARPDRTHVLKTFKKPIMIIAGKFDTAVPLEKCLEQAHLGSFSYIHICNNSGHMGMLEEPRDCNDTLSKFLKEI
jgi:pimeloyl-ACP methyl ester carboxylesterase